VKGVEVRFPGGEGGFVDEINLLHHKKIKTRQGFNIKFWGLLRMATGQLIKKGLWRITLLNTRTSFFFISLTT
jgi:hypothetical protein